MSLQNRLGIAEHWRAAAEDRAAAVVPTAATAAAHATSPHSRDDLDFLSGAH